MRRDVTVRTSEIPSIGWPENRRNGARDPQFFEGFSGYEEVWRCHCNAVLPSPDAKK